MERETIMLNGNYRVRKNPFGYELHSFKIGEIVEVIELNPVSIICRNDAGKSQILFAHDLEQA